MAVPYVDDECGREGGWVAEPGVRCWECGSKFTLMFVDGRYHCKDRCEDIYRWVKKHGRRANDGTGVSG